MLKHKLKQTAQLCKADGGKIFGQSSNKQRRRSAVNFGGPIRNMGTALLYVAGDLGTLTLDAK